MRKGPPQVIGSKRKQALPRRGSYPPQGKHAPRRGKPPRLRCRERPQGSSGAGEQGQYAQKGARRAGNMPSKQAPPQGRIPP